MAIKKIIINYSKKREWSVTASLPFKKYGFTKDGLIERTGGRSKCTGSDTDIGTARPLRRIFFEGLKTEASANAVLSKLKKLVKKLPGLKLKKYSSHVPEKKIKPKVGDILKKVGNKIVILRKIKNKKKKK